MRVSAITAAATILALAACSDAGRAPPPESSTVVQPVPEDVEAIDADCGCKRKPIRRLPNPITPKSE